MNAFSQLNTEYSAGNPESQIVLRFFRRPAGPSVRAGPLKKTPFEFVFERIRWYINRKGENAARNARKRNGAFAKKGGRTPMKEVIWGLMIPFAGTVAGAGCVLFLRRTPGDNAQRAMTGFAAGVMVAASVWSLLIPAMELSGDLGRWAFAPAAGGFLLGVAFLLLLDRVTPHLHRHADRAEGPASRLTRTVKLILAVTLHNIPEGLAVGVVYAGMLAGDAGISGGGAMAISLGIAIQNFPEGAIVSMPLHSGGRGRWRAFLWGALSGAVEPAFGALALLAAELVAPAMPCLLSFAAGAMLYVVVEELIPEMSAGKHSNVGMVSFAVGFALMMALDVALG